MSLENEKEIVLEISEKKPISLSKEEKRAVIINNAKNEIEQPHYDLQFLKNGNRRIIKKKRSSSNSIAEGYLKKRISIYYTDNQLFFEHIIELNSKVDKFMYKQKNLNENAKI